MSENLEERKHDLEVRKFEESVEKRKEESGLKREELAQKRDESTRNDKGKYTTAATAVIAALFSLASAGLTAYLGGFFSLESQRERSRSELRLKELEWQFQLILKATENRTPDEAARNLLFFVDIGYLPDPESKVRKKVDRREVPIFRSGAGQPTASELAQRTGIDNTAPKQADLAFSYLRQQIVDPIEKKFAKPIAMLSGYRSPELNRLLGGGANSAHIRGEAIDFTVEGISPQELACWIRENLNYDELFLEPIQETVEPKWVHVAIAKGSNKRLERRVSCP